MTDGDREKPLHRVDEAEEVRSILYLCKRASEY